MSTSSKILCKTYSLATIKHSKPLWLENYLGVVFAPDLQNVFVNSKEEFRQRSLHHQALVTPDTYKKGHIELYRYYASNRREPCGCCGAQIGSKWMTTLVSVKRLTQANSCG